jgi:hypothetical protein
LPLVFPRIDQYATSVTGGGILDSGALTLESSTVSENSAGLDGG